MSKIPDTSVTERVALLPCPFCGNDGSGPIEDALHVSHIEDAEHYAYDLYTVQCDRCTATMGYIDSEDAAIDAWNTRVAISSMPQPDASATERVARTIYEANPDTYWSASLERTCTRAWGDLGTGQKVKFQRQARAAISSMPSLEEELRDALRENNAENEALEEENARLREQGQAEGFAAAVQWLRERRAMKPPATLWHAAEVLADQMEQSRIPATSTREGLSTGGQKADHLQLAADLARARLNRGEGAIHAALTSTREGLSTEGEEV